MLQRRQFLSATLAGAALGLGAGRQAFAQGEAWPSRPVRIVVAWAPGSRLVSDWVEVGAGSNVDINLRLDSKAPGHKNKSGQAYGSYE